VMTAVMMNETTSSAIAQTKFMRRGPFRKFSRRRTATCRT
jgi:hypothetical protein